MQCCVGRLAIAHNTTHVGDCVAAVLQDIQHRAMLQDTLKEKLLATYGDKVRLAACPQAWRHTSVPAYRACAYSLLLPRQPSESSQRR